MKQTLNGKSKKNGYHSDDDNVRYKINTKILNSATKASTSKKGTSTNDDDNIRYKLPPPPPQKNKSNERKPKLKPRIKVNFWSNKQTSRITKPEINKRSNRRHTVGGSIKELIVKPKTSAVKVRKRVSFLPSPLFSDNHIPMVTVPDDLTIQLNEEEANDLADDLNLANANRQLEQRSNENSKKKARATLSQTSPTGAKRKRNSDDADPRHQGNDNELEFFSKYVVQKLRRMETNQRIYSENLINTVLMLGQLAKLNVKSKISEA
ncbi:uncharacterized protein LOC120626099 [Pararge aegeria]|uniref:Jg4328 protein n=2 Tax=Pararge aegeria TaxID=116150 RepID=A0A8S4SLZ7_9NEOP|nr:uncharacterized protein LOC120626099 [Pararge aegeria]CAH2267720.1 jg4328 [Pararge aegeria aegeria]